MRRHYHLAPLRVLTLVVVCITLLLPLGNPALARAQGEECPEGLVYVPSDDACMLEEDVPEGVEFIDQHADTSGEDDGSDNPDATDNTDTTDNADTTETDEDMDPGVTQDIAEDDAAPDEPAVADDPTATIKNLTLLTFACPVNWDPATRPIESSREMCTEPIVPNMTYSILFEGEEVVVAALGSDIDLASDRQDDDGVVPPIPPGMWTIWENMQEGLEDPFAFCAIYAADGSTRLTVMETVRGGSLDILLAAGEEVNCEWFSVATVPEVAAAPSLGLEVKVFSCPAPAEFSGGLDDCTLPLPGPVTFEAIYDGQVMATGTLSSAEFPYEVDQEALSGEWTIRPILQEGWVDPHLTCTSVSYVGDYIGEITHFPPVDGTLGVTVRLNPDQRAQCQIWLFAGDVRESVVVVTRDCPEDYNAATLSPGVRKATCPGLQFQDVSVTVDDAAPVLVESTRNGVAVFPTQPGTWRIQVDTGEGVVGRAVTFVTCDQTFAALGQVQTIEPTINTDQRSVSIDLDEGDALRCDFFFGPEAVVAEEASAAEAEAVETAEETGAETTDPEAADPEAADPGMEPETGDGETDAETDAPEPAPSDETFGGGSTASDSDDGTGPPETATDDDTTAEPVVAGTSSLALQHWDCPEPIALEATADDLIATCTASVQPSSWVLNGNPVDADDGYVVWEELPLESVVVSNGAALGKEDAASAVYCSLALTNVDEPLIGVEAAVRNGAIELVFDRPSVVYCNWFVAP